MSEPREESGTAVQLQPAADPPPKGRGLRAALAATGISSLGDGAWVAAVPLTAAAITRSPAAVAAVSAATYLPWLLVSPVAGVLVDRWPRRAVLVIADLARGVLIALLTLALVLGLVSIPLLAVAAFLVVTGVIFHNAAAQALVADLTDHDQGLRDRTNGRISSLETGGASLIGPPAGAAAYAAAPWLPFAADAASFAVSGILLSRVPRGSKHESVGSTQNIWQALLAGARFLWRHGQLRTLALLSAISNFTNNCAMAVLVLFATSANGLNVTDAGYGLLIATLAVGGVIGGPIAPWLLRRLGDHWSVVAAMGSRMLVWLVIAVSSSPYVVGVALAVAGFASTLVTVTVTGARQRLTPRNMLGRVITAYRTLGNGASPVGAMAGGLIAAAYGLRASFVVAGLVLAIAVVATIPALWAGRGSANGR